MKNKSPRTCHYSAGSPCCSLHDAAEEMLRAARRAARYLTALDPGEPGASSLCELNAAIAKAEEDSK